MQTSPEISAHLVSPQQFLSGLDAAAAPTGARPLWDEALLAAAMQSVYAPNALESRTLVDVLSSTEARILAATPFIVHRLPGLPAAASSGSAVFLRAEALEAFLPKSVGDINDREAVTQAFQTAVRGLMLKLLQHHKAGIMGERNPALPRVSLSDFGRDPQALLAVLPPAAHPDADKNLVRQRLQAAIDLNPSDLPENSDDALQALLEMASRDAAARAANAEPFSSIAALVSDISLLDRVAVDKIHDVLLAASITYPHPDFDSPQYLSAVGNDFADRIKLIKSFGSAANTHRFTDVVLDALSNAGSIKSHRLSNEPTQLVPVSASLEPTLSEVVRTATRLSALPRMEPVDLSEVMGFFNPLRHAADLALISKGGSLNDFDNPPLAVCLAVLLRDGLQAVADWPADLIPSPTGAPSENTVYAAVTSCLRVAPGRVSEGVVEDGLVRVLEKLPCGFVANVLSDSRPDLFTSPRCAAVLRSAEDQEKKIRESFENGSASSAEADSYIRKWAAALR